VYSIFISRVGTGMYYIGAVRGLSCDDKFVDFELT
jgi:hypothetical protein